MKTDDLLPAAILPESRLSDLVTRWAGASRALQRFDLDYCCNGDVSVAEACRQRRLPLAEVLAALRAETEAIEPIDRWDDRPIAQLLSHILDRYHAGHRAELPQLIAMADKVERVHADKPECPFGLTEHLQNMALEMETHMQKEEQCLFPMMIDGRGRQAGAPIDVMREEHDEHGRNLAHMRRLADDFEPPADACNTWRSLYLRLAEFEREVMEHVHLENHVLFPRALAGR